MKLKIVIAPDSFKGSLTSVQAANAICSGIKKVFPQADCTSIPLADGGEGTIDAVLAVFDGEKIYKRVHDPLGRLIDASFGWIEDRKMAIVETAAASGLPLLSREELNPLVATTYGTGELVKYALDYEPEHLIIGIGGSATVDAGIGFFQALGIQFYDGNRNTVEGNGRATKFIKEIDISGLDPRLNSTKITVMSDVTNPLLGETGAIAVFGKQKGVKEEEFPQYERWMANFADVVERSIGRDEKERSGSGAAGGLGFALRSFLQVEMKGGFSLIAELSNLEEKIKEASIVITGEGRIDASSLFGKVPIGIGNMARKYGIPCAAFAGAIEGDLEKLEAEGISLTAPIVDAPMLLEEAITNAESLLEKSAFRFMQALKVGKEIR
ncbi:glycerate kinase [Neobacillus massiliamazoniensis]|uniref:glycerate kinase n=1 Tax=Neobacillus massiliamazoniensis TaxID=1499688 RepID=UPI000B853199|nr:glycerate kinase [Neobacillus massiliamazoniensis]